MYQYSEPFDKSLTPFLSEFFQVERTQCLCYNGWVIQGLGELKLNPDHLKSSIVIDTSISNFPSTPENFSSGIAVSVACISFFYSRVNSFPNLISNPRSHFSIY